MKLATQLASKLTLIILSGFSASSPKHIRIIALFYMLPVLFKHYRPRRAARNTINLSVDRHLGLNLLVEGIGVLGIEGLVCPHDRHEVLGVGQVGDGVCVARDHLDHAHVAPLDDVLVDRVGLALGVGPHPPQLDGGGTGDHQEPLPLAHVPVVALGDAGPRDVDRDLAALGRAQELRERAARVHVGPEAVGEVARLVVGQERAPELLGEGALGQVGHRESLAAVPEAVEQVDDLAQGLHVGLRDVAELLALHAVQPLVSAAVLLAQQRAQHLADQVVDVEELQLHRGVVHGVGAAVRDGVAEGGHGGVVARAAPLAVEVGEAVDEHRGPGALRVLAEQALPRELGLAVDRALEAAGEARLRGAGEHDGALIPIVLQGVQQRGGEPEVALHELGLVLWAVDAGQVEHEVGAGAVPLQLRGGRVDVVLHDLEGKELLVFGAAVLAVPYVLQRAAEVPAHEAPRACDEDAHPTAPPRARGPPGPAARTRRS